MAIGITIEINMGEGMACILLHITRQLVTFKNHDQILSKTQAAFEFISHMALAQEC